MNHDCGLIKAGCKVFEDIDWNEQQQVEKELRE
jgi:hypothetical protein